MPPPLSERAQRNSDAVEVLQRCSHICITDDKAKFFRCMDGARCVFRRKAHRETGQAQRSLGRGPAAEPRIGADVVMISFAPHEQSSGKVSLARFKTERLSVE
jgi:hypothetical protein